jgi:O-antigen/teichoic acid export membrane protein
LNSFLLFISRFSGAIFSALTLFVLTRQLTQEEFGKYSLFITSASIISVFFFQWLSVIISRFLTASPQLIIKITLQLFYFISFFLLIISTLFVFFTKSNLEVLLVVIAGISLGYFTLQTQIAISLEERNKYNLLMLAKYIISFLFIYLLTLKFKSSYWALLAFSIGSFIPILLNKKNTFKGEIKYISKKKIIKFGIPFTLISLSTMFIDFIDRYILKYFKGLIEVAKYSANYDLVQQIIGGTLSVFALYFMPQIITARNNNKELDEFNYKKKYLVFTLTFGLLTVSNFLLLYPVFSTILNNNYRYKTLLEISFISLGIFFGSLKGTIFDLQLQLEGKTKIILYNVIFMTIFNLFLNFIFVPIFGQTGAALATFVSFLFGTIISVYFSFRSFNFNFKFYTDSVLLFATFFLLLYLSSFIIKFTILYSIIYGILNTFIFLLLLLVLNIFNSRIFFLKKIKHIHNYNFSIKFKR